MKLKVNSSLLVKHPKLYKLQTILLNYSALLFIIGIFINMFFYVETGKMLHWLIDFITIVLLLVIWTLFWLGYITSNKGLIFFLVSVSLNLCFSIIGEILIDSPNAGECILAIMCISVIPVLMFIATSAPWMSATSGGAIFVCYLLAGIVMKNTRLIEKSPVIAMVMLGAFGILWVVYQLACKLETASRQAAIEEEQLFRFFNVSAKEWQLIKEGQMDKVQIENVLQNMNEKTRKRVFYKIRNEVREENAIKQAVLAHYPRLTTGELDLIYLIVEGKSVNEISQIRQVKISAVTAARSRLRGKLFIPHNSNLRNYLESLINDKKN